MITDTDWAYIAGFLDGEGCITHPNGKPLISASQRDPRPILWLQSKVGGRVRTREDKRFDDGRKSWVWHSSRLSTHAKVMEGIRPYSYRWGGDK